MRLWKVDSFGQILLGVQDLLNDPNPESPAQQDAYMLFRYAFSYDFFYNLSILYRRDKKEYERRVREQAQQNRPTWNIHNKQQQYSFVIFFNLHHSSPTPLYAVISTCSVTSYQINASSGLSSECKALQISPTAPRFDDEMLCTNQAKGWLNDSHPVKLSLNIEPQVSI